jgi:hypothetical protein
MSLDRQLKCLVKLNKEGEEKNNMLHEEKQKLKEEIFAKECENLINLSWAVNMHPLQSKSLG